MTSQARRAIALIRACVQSDRFALSVHFFRRLEQRGLFWPDVRAVIEAPVRVRGQDVDDHGRPKWLISGESASGGTIEIVCAIELDESETEFITLYWED